MSKCLLDTEYKQIPNQTVVNKVLRLTGSPYDTLACKAGSNWTSLCRFGPHYAAELGKYENRDPGKTYHTFTFLLKTLMKLEVNNWYVTLHLCWNNNSVSASKFKKNISITSLICKLHIRFSSIKNVQRSWTSYSSYLKSRYLFQLFSNIHIISLHRKKESEGNELNHLTHNILLKKTKTSNKHIPGSTVRDLSQGKGGSSLSFCLPGQTW